MQEHIITDEGLVIVGLKKYPEKLQEYMEKDIYDRCKMEYIEMRIFDDGGTYSVIARFPAGYDFDLIRKSFRNYLAYVYSIL